MSIASRKSIGAVEFNAESVGEFQPNTAALPPHTAERLGLSGKLFPLPEAEPQRVEVVATESRRLSGLCGARGAWVGMSDALG